MRFELDKPQVGDGLRLLRSIRQGMVGCVVFDAQYRGVLDAMAFGNEGERQIVRAELPQMSRELILSMLVEIERVLRPAAYCLMWVDKFELNEKQYVIPDLKVTDILTWDKGRMGMGKRTRRQAEYLRVLQKAPTESCNWSDHGIPDVWSERAYGHAHAKPIELQKRLIAAVTELGDVVVDPSAGGYSAMFAAHAVGRRFLGCDLREFTENREAE